MRQKLWWDCLVSSRAHLVEVVTRQVNKQWVAVWGRG